MTLRLAIVYMLYAGSPVTSFEIVIKSGNDGSLVSPTGAVVYVSNNISGFPSRDGGNGDMYVSK